ncbi:hypothetical protein ACCO45_012397 [Purpureocillium lilacinum]|uniref:Uncharacterized protein n=1 Tax=Purpureocillium lilacinum TaxID=33203 RepID=A0ACC4DA03_PURLI
MPEFRHVRSGSLNIPNGSAGHAHGQMMPRSPPSAFPPACVSRAVSHVSCPLQVLSAGRVSGRQCLPVQPRHWHLDRDGVQILCQGQLQVRSQMRKRPYSPRWTPHQLRQKWCHHWHLAHKPRGPPSPTPTSPTSASSAAYHQGSTSALTSSLYRAEQPSYPIGYSGDEHQHHLGRQPSLDNGIPAIDMPFSTSTYGSPRDEDPSRLGFGLSPANGKGLSILDAPLPASFDSNGISHAARFPSAPWPSSVPSKFGLESPTPSLSNAKDSRTSETLKLLHTSAFGSSEHLVTPTASSPPNSQPFDGEEYFGKRAMHSSRYARPRMLSSSLPKTSVDRDWEAEFAFGDDGDNAPENYVPENLQDLLTPAEKARRGSMRAEDPVIEGISKYGSPIGSSPSRWGSLFQRQKEEEDASRAGRGGPVGPSAFGHVGSPLRKSTLAQEMGGEAKSPNGSLRPSSFRSGSESMSVLSQQLQRSRLDDNISSSSPLLHPTTARISAGGIGAIGKDRAMERHVSSGSISSSVTGRFTTPIDEEDPAFVFSMEEEEDSSNARARKRASAGLGMGGGFASYASAAAGRGVPTASKESKDNVPVNGR